MSKIKELKENKNHQSNLVDVITTLLPDVQTKYIELICRIVSNETNKYKYGENLGDYQKLCLIFFKKLLSDNGLSEKTLSKFIEFNEKNLVEKNDLSTYKSFNEITMEYSKAEKKEEQKRLENDIINVFENDEWLILIPLTYQSSVKYGYGTKWCTAMINDSSYFHKYAKTGILIYIIDKKKNRKIAVYSSSTLNGEVSFWNYDDVKFNDSMMTGLPLEVLEKVRVEVIKNNNETVTGLYEKKHPSVLQSVFDQYTNTLKKPYIETTIDDLDFATYFSRRDYGVLIDSDRLTRISDIMNKNRK